MQISNIAIKISPVASPSSDVVVSSLGLLVDKNDFSNERNHHRITIVTPERTIYNSLTLWRKFNHIVFHILPYVNYIFAAFAIKISLYENSTFSPRLFLAHTARVRPSHVHMLFPYSSTPAREQRNGSRTSAVKPEETRQCWFRKAQAIAFIRTH